MAMPDNTVLYKALSTSSKYAASPVISPILLPNMASAMDAQLSE